MFDCKLHVHRFIILVWRINSLTSRSYNEWPYFQRRMLVIKPLFYIQRSTLVINHFFLYFQRNTLWSPDQCSICTCEDPVVMCEDVRCSSPNCDTKKVIFKKRLMFYFFFLKMWWQYSSTNSHNTLTWWYLH